MDYSIPCEHPDAGEILAEHHRALGDDPVCGVYIIHFDDTLGEQAGDFQENGFLGTGHAKHYIGSSKDILARLVDHLQGKSGHLVRKNGRVSYKHGGARILNVCNHRGIRYHIAKIIVCATEKQARAEEARLKGSSKYARLCPHCNGKGE